MCTNRYYNTKSQIIQTTALWTPRKKLTQHLNQYRASGWAFRPVVTNTTMRSLRSDFQVQSLQINLGYILYENWFRIGAIILLAQVCQSNM